MAASLTRVYNLGPEQLRGALAAACASFNGTRRPVAEWPPGNFMLSTPAFRWPLTSYGEKVEAIISTPGTVSIYSTYAMPTQVFELGDNVANVEKLATALEGACAGLPPSCPACAASVGRDAGFCNACGQQLFESSKQPPVPNRARSIRLKALLFTLLVAAIPIVGLIAVYARILSY